MVLQKYATVIDGAEELSCSSIERVKRKFVIYTEKNGKFLVNLNIRKLKDKKLYKSKEDIHKYQAVRHHYIQF